jgi:GntR family transcriptional regulator of arabinose operon
MNSNNDYRKEAENIYRMKKEGVKGLIIMPAEDQKDSNAISDLKKEGFPFVLVDRRLQDCETNCVMSDNIEGAFSAVEHLIQLGHNKIAFLKNNYEQTSSIIDRIIGYKKAIEEYSINKKLIFSYDSNSDRESKNNEIFKIIKENSITAILSMNDYVALDILKMCRNKDISIPNDLSLVGFDNLDLLKHLEVPMTTVAQHPFEIGSLAAEMLTEKISEEKETKFITQNFYPTNLIIRNSTCSLK